jgi:hypothetical protein
MAGKRAEGRLGSWAQGQPASTVGPCLLVAALWPSAPAADAPARPPALQDYIDSMEGATLSGRLCAASILDAAPKLLAGAPASQARVPAGAAA